MLARARGPNALTRADREAGPRLLLRTTSMPALTSCCAMALPMAPAPMIPIVVCMVLLQFKE